MSESVRDSRVGAHRNESRYLVYRELAGLDVEYPETRRSREVIDRLIGLGMQAVDLDVYWHRVRFVADNCRGRVLEIGCATGNVSKYIARSKLVERVLAIDIIDEYVEFLRNLALDRIEVQNINLVFDRLDADAKFNCVVMSEIIEHLSYKQECKMLDHIRPALSEDSVFVITTPIGYMPDPDHRRGFSRIACVLHLWLLYGRILRKSDNGIQQFYVVKFERRSRCWRALGRALSFQYEIRDSFKFDRRRDMMSACPESD